MSLPSPRPLPTTGRIASRLDPAAREKIRAGLQAFPLPPADAWPAWVELELGIGNGQALAARAKGNPAGFYVGTDVYLNGLAQAAKAAQGLPNVALLATDARELVDTLAPQSLDRVLIAHPDPWPKTSHHKRRLVQPPVLDAVARVLKPHGELWVVTDWPDYAFHALSLLHAHPGLQLAQTGPAAHCKVKPKAGEAPPLALGPQHLATPPAWWVPTAYQQKAARLGRAAWFLQAIRA